MTNIESPAAVVNRMLDKAREVERVEDMPRVGTYAMEYAKQISDRITPESVDAFMHGTALINILVQEAILRLHMVGMDCAKEAETEKDIAFIEGTSSATSSMARLMVSAVEAVVKSACEEQHYNRAFNDIVTGF